MAFRHTKRGRAKLLMGVAMCVAAGAVMTMLRGGRGLHAFRGPVEAGLPEGALNVVAPSSGDHPESALAPTASLSGKLASQLAQIYAQTDIDQQTRELNQVANQIPVADIRGILNALQGSAKRSLDSELTLLLLTRWAQADARTASTWVQEQMEGSTRQQGLNTVAVAWAQSDQDGALEWAKHLAEGDERGEVLSALTYEIGRDNPAAASALVADLPPGRGREEVSAYVASVWASTSPSQALEWAAKLPAEELRQNAIAALAVAWAESDPTSAGTLAVGSLSEGRLQDNTVVGIVQRWAQQDPAQAGAWVTGFPEGPLRDTAVEELVKLWTNKDPEQAGQWLNSLAPGQTHDVAVGAYAGAIAVEHPKVATEWLNNIADETLRYDEMEKIAELWLSNDPGPARAWIAEASLPQTRKAKLLSPRAE